MTTVAAEARQTAQTHELVLAGLVGQLQQSTTTLSQLSATPVVAAVDVSAPDPTHASALVLRASADLPEPCMGTPECYDGDHRMSCHPFLTNCSLLFALQLHTFTTEEVKVAFVINHLIGSSAMALI